MEAAGVGAGTVADGGPGTAAGVKGDTVELDGEISCGHRPWLGCELVCKVGRGWGLGPRRDCRLDFCFGVVAVSSRVSF